MAEPHSDFQRELSRLRELFVAGLRDKSADLSRTYRVWVQDGSGGDLLHRKIHALTGAGATYGLASVSEAARDVELHLSGMLSGAVARTREELLALDLRFAVLLETVRECSGVDAAGPLSGVAKRDEASKAAVFLCADRANVSDCLEPLRQAGYQCHVATSAADVELTTAATVLVLDESFWEGASKERLAALPGEVPRVFLTRDGGVAARLRAVRLGARDVLKPPLGASAIHRLDELLLLDLQQPYRVLIVEDNAQLARFYAAALRSAGMIVEVVHDPLEVMQPLHAFRPELVLLDLNMPECNGIELCTVLRQQDEWISVPIVFVSGETSWQKQAAAMSAGGDDFLLKPVSPDQLVAAVLHRARRLRRLGGYIGRDSLTRLLNHAAYNERLSMEFSRARRDKRPLSVAALDLDHFKAVNDTHGHPAGDRVLCRLARLMQERFRQTDAVARVGGEEFAVILPGANHMNALALMEEMRKGFQELVHTSDFGEFRVTLSCGVAELGAQSSAEELHALADKALYRAKREGRNRVTLPP
ncbi:MAG TPA: diguanylate cyclase [Polyangiaceae bacterium]